MTSLCLFFLLRPVDTPGHPICAQASKRASLSTFIKGSYPLPHQPASRGLPGSQEVLCVHKASDVPWPPLIAVALGRQGTRRQNYTQLPGSGDFCSEANTSPISQGFDQRALSAVDTSYLRKEGAGAPGSWEEECAGCRGGRRRGPPGAGVA